MQAQGGHENPLPASPDYERSPHPLGDADRGESGGHRRETCRGAPAQRDLVSSCLGIQKSLIRKIPSITRPCTSTVRPATTTLRRERRAERTRASTARAIPGAGDVVANRSTASLTVQRVAQSTPSVASLSQERNPGSVLRRTRCWLPTRSTSTAPPSRSLSTARATFRFNERATMASSASDGADALDVARTARMSARTATPNKARSRTVSAPGALMSRTCALPRDS